MEEAANQAPRCANLWEYCLSTATTSAEWDLSFLVLHPCLSLPCLSSPICPFLWFPSHLSSFWSFYLLAGDHQLSLTLAFINNCPEAVPEPWDSCCAWRRWKPAWAQPQSVLPCSFYTRSHWEIWQPLLHANHICTCMCKGYRQASNYLQRGMGIYFCACGGRWTWAPTGFGRI